MSDANLLLTWSDIADLFKQVKDKLLLLGNTDDSKDCLNYINNADRIVKTKIVELENPETLNKMVELFEAKTV